MWNQVKDANWRIPYVGGWCLKYVQDAFGTDHPYPNAMAAWNANYGNGNHPNEQPPVGKTVPVYFALGSVPEGHVAICLDDGKVASSTQPGSHAQGYLHPNLQNLINVYGKYNGGCTYLGWSEYVGTQRVLAPEQVNATVAEIQQDYQDILERPADASGLAHYQNYTNNFVRTDLQNSAEYKQLQANKAAAAQAAEQAAQVAAAAAAVDAQPAVVPVTTPEPSVVVPPVTEPSTQPVPVTPIVTGVTKPNFLQVILNLIVTILKAIAGVK